MLPTALALVLVREPGWLELRWPEVEGCPSAAEVTAAAERLVAAGVGRAVEAEAAIVSTASGYSLDLWLRAGDEVEHRRADNARCGPLADAAAVILAVAAEPPAPTPGRPAGRDDEVPPGLRRTPPLVVREPPAVGAFVAAAAAVGPPRRPAAAIQAGLAVLWPRARLELRFHHSFASPLRYAGGEAGAQLSLSAGAVRAGPRWARRAVAIHVSGGLELGALTARGVGLADNDRTTGLWAAAVVGPGLQWRPRPWLGLGLEVEAAVPFTRRGYTVAGASALLYRVPPAGARAAAGVTLFFF